MASKLKLKDQSQRIRILMVDDHKVVRQGLRMFIEKRSDMLVVGEAGNGNEALSLAGREQPDIILLELDLGGSSSLGFLEEMISVSGGARVIVLTGVRDPDAHFQAVGLGALGVMMKDQSADMLLRAIERVHAGEAWLDHKTTANVIAQLSRPRRLNDEAAKIDSLTVREREIVTVVSEGLKNRQIAERLFISEATVRNHLTTILSKLGLSDRFELAIYSYRHGLADPPRQYSHQADKN
jgi:two-component system, NarL family, nitrate/nitrite response regulator NarL